MRTAAALALLAWASPVAADELPSFLRPGDAFCTDEADFDDFAARNAIQPGAAVQTCRLVQTPTRVAVIGGTGGVKSVVRVTSGPGIDQVGWTNGALPVIP